LLILIEPKNAHAIAVLTEWDEFVQYDWQKIYDSMLKPASLMEEITDRSQMESIWICVSGDGFLNGKLRGTML
jgi:UDPglucose 6-dehydrogenase